MVEQKGLIRSQIMKMLGYLPALMASLSFIGPLYGGYICDPLAPVGAFNACPRPLNNLVNDFGNLVAGKAEASAKIQLARQRFFQARPNTPEQAKAGAEFGELLFQKDLWYLTMELFQDQATPGNLDSRSRPAMDVIFGLIPIDGGIPTYTQATFNLWKRSVSRTLERKRPSTLSGWLQLIPGLLADVKGRAYDRYRLERDWVEYAAAGRNLRDDPEQYTKAIIGIANFFASDPDYVQPDFYAQIDQCYTRMAGLFGAESMVKAARRVMAAPKNNQGFLDPPFSVGGQAYGRPIGAFLGAIGEMSSRNYALLCILRQWGRYDERSVSVAQAIYKRWAMAYGEKAVSEAAEQVRRAEKNVDGEIRDIAQLKVRRRLSLALDDFLSNKDRKGYIKEMLADHFELDSAQAVDAEYSKLVAQHGETKLIQSIDQVKATWTSPNPTPETYKLQYQYARGELTIGDVYDLWTGVLSGAKTLPAPVTGADIVEVPQYKAWSKFQPGTKVFYASRTTVEQKGRQVPGGASSINPYKGILEEYRLKSVDDQNVVYEMQEKVCEPPKVFNVHTHDVGFPARMNKAMLNSGRRQQQETQVTETSGNQPLEVNGKTYACRWAKSVDRNAGGGWSVRIVTRWESDEVPGGLVRERTEEFGRGDFLKITERVLQQFPVENLAELNSPAPRFEIKPELPPGSSEAPAIARSAPPPVHNQVDSSTAAEELARSLNQYAGGWGMTLAETITLAGVDAGKDFRATLDADVGPQTRILVPKGADVFLKVQRAGVSLSRPLVSIKVDYLMVGENKVPIPCSQVKLPLEVKRELAHSVIRGPIPDSYWESPPNMHIMPICDQTFSSANSAVTGATPATPPTRGRRR